ncbi:interleukin-1 beta [Polymixia lowei]
MMCDFDLAQALESSPESDKIGSEHCSCEATDLQERLWIEMEPVVSQRSKSIKTVASIMMLQNRMSKVCTMESLVNEKVIKMVQDFTRSEKKTFNRVHSVDHCTLCDTSQKDLVLPPGGLELQAITLKGGNTSQKVRFKLAQYSCFPAGPTQTVALSLMDTNLYISCHEVAGKVVLHLEKCEENMKTISTEDLCRFLFYTGTGGSMSHNNFESVKHRGWFISTSDDEKQRVEMCEKDAASRLTCFSIH